MKKKFYIRNAERFLDLNWYERIYKSRDIRRHELADMLDLTYMQSLRMCKRNFGLTIEKFYLRCWVAEFKQHLAQPEALNKQIKDIAREVGYHALRTSAHNFSQMEEMTQREFRYFHKHFVETTGMTLAEYEQPELKEYIPENGQPSFLSNFLNRQKAKLIHKKNHIE